MRASRHRYAAAVGGLVAMAAMALALAGGCSYDWELPADGGPDLGDADAGVDTDAARDAGETGGDAGVCDATDACASGFRCAFPDHRCGAAALGTCVPEPGATCGVTGVDAATSAGSSFCGCNGQTYSSTCTLYRAGGDLGLGCTPTPTQHRCGYVLCDSADFCVHHVADDTYSCTAFSATGPGGCVAKDCTCTTGVCAGGTCTNDVASGVTLVCP